MYISLISLHFYSLRFFFDSSAFYIPCRPFRTGRQNHWEVSRNSPKILAQLIYYTIPFILFFSSIQIVNRLILIEGSTSDPILNNSNNGDWITATRTGRNRKWVANLRNNAAPPSFSCGQLCLYNIVSPFPAHSDRDTLGLRLDTDVPPSLMNAAFNCTIPGIEVV